MFFKVSSFALMGIQAINISVEIHISNGLPSFTIVGLPDKAVNESRQRVRAAIINSGYKFPSKRIIINLSPADIKKEGAFYDLPVAISILAVSSQIENIDIGLINNSSFIGELSLDGEINPIRGIISMAEQCNIEGKKYFFVPEGNAVQAGYIIGPKIVKCKDLKGVIKQITDKYFLSDRIYTKNDKTENKNNRQDIISDSSDIDFLDIKGQLRAKRAMEIAVSGRHNIILVGPPGAGKSMLAQRVTTIMPLLAANESIEVTKIYSLYKKYKEILIKTRPFRNPHHTISRASLIGGGIIPKPGEISLAHRGVLFLDEFSQFPRLLIEDLRQPLENREIIIAKNNLFYKYPCNFMLIVATNPCACGYFKDEKKKCRCSVKEIENYWKNISGPIMDRIDMRINVPRLKEEDLLMKTKGETSNIIRKRVLSCHEIQKKRYKDLNINYNSEADLRFINSWINENDGIKRIIPGILNSYSLSGRALASIIKISRTIADIDGTKIIKTEHLMEALNYRINFNYD